jgi:hypothetical protein
MARTVRVAGVCVEGDCDCRHFDGRPLPDNITPPFHDGCTCLVVDDTSRGLYAKYEVWRADGESGPGGKHEKCQFFVLDLDHDPHALPALRAYIASCRQQYPELAADLGRLIDGR